MILKAGSLAWIRGDEDSSGSAWTYDNVGNIETRTDGAGSSETNTYDFAYRIVATDKIEPGEDDNTTTTTFDLDGNTIKTKSGKTTFTYNYNSAGLLTSITGAGPDSAKGTSKFTYDDNGRLIIVNRGSGDDDSASTLKTFDYDNEGRITRRVTVGGDDEGTTYYLYKNGKPVGEYSSASDPVMNTGTYSVFQTISVGFGDDDSANPGSSITSYTVQGGESLKSLAAQNYGSPDLWYLIADANGLTGNEKLTAGARLVIPNSANNAFQTSETNALYKRVTLSAASYQT